MTIRQKMWDVGIAQYGFVTATDARRLGVPIVELGKLASRGKLRQVAYGVYRFPEWPAGPRDYLMEAVLWTRDPTAVLSHESALGVHELSDIEPDQIHITIPVRAKPLRRRHAPARYVVHYENLAATQRTFWEQIPTVTPLTAIDQCIAAGVRSDLVRQAIDAACARGLVDQPTAERQLRLLASDADDGELDDPAQSQPRVTPTPLALHRRQNRTKFRPAKPQNLEATTQWRSAARS